MPSVDGLTLQPHLPKQQQTLHPRPQTIHNRTPRVTALILFDRLLEASREIIGRVRVEYVALSSKQIDLKLGHTVTKIRTIGGDLERGFAFGECDGVRGYFPLEFITLVQDKITKESLCKFDGTSSDFQPQWYYGVLSRQEAEIKLKEPGDFLVREGSIGTVISIMSSARKPEHIGVLEGTGRLVFTKGGPGYDTIGEAVYNLVATRESLVSSPPLILENPVVE
eukprot:m.69660 g.69660  ORF g.69660 m.69660 type:complete len:224 (-) comp20006_c0_seq3:24-695(-)